MAPRPSLPTPGLPPRARTDPNSKTRKPPPHRLARGLDPSSGRPPTTPSLQTAPAYVSPSPAAGPPAASPARWPCASVVPRRSAALPARVSATAGPGLPGPVDSRHGAPAGIWMPPAAPGSRNAGLAGATTLTGRSSPFAPGATPAAWTGPKRVRTWPSFCAWALKDVQVCGTTGVDAPARRTEILRGPPRPLTWGRARTGRSMVEGAAGGPRPCGRTRARTRWTRLHPFGSRPVGPLFDQVYRRARHQVRKAGFPPRRCSRPSSPGIATSFKPSARRPGDSRALPPQADR